MARNVLPESHIHPAIRDRVTGRNSDILAEVQAAIAEHTVVVVGMSQNPNPMKACRILKSKGVDHVFLSYGSYLSQWRRRNSLKMWSGWPTFPMVFVNGMLVGGASDLQALAASGELDTLLAAPRPEPADGAVA